MRNKLRCATYSERLLQDHFDRWPKERGNRVGTPPWIECLCDWKGHSSFYNSWGALFKSDALAHDGSNVYVFELKYAHKYEPLALAKIAHHAYALAKVKVPVAQGWPVGQRVRPVIISQFSGWIRHARSYLLENNLDSDAIILIEVAALTSSIDQREWLWFVEVDGRDPWIQVTHDELPADAKEHIEPSPGARYYARRGAETYARLNGGSALPHEYEIGVEQRWIARTYDGGHWLTWDSTSMEQGSDRYEIVDARP